MTDTIYVSLGEMHEKWTLSEYDFRISFWHHMMSLFTILILNRYICIHISRYILLERERERARDSIFSIIISANFPPTPKKFNHFQLSAPTKSKMPTKVRVIPTHMGVSLNGGTPKSSILIGFSIIFTIHFGVPLFSETPISSPSASHTASNIHTLPSWWWYATKLSPLKCQSLWVSPGIFQEMMFCFFSPFSMVKSCYQKVVVAKLVPSKIDCHRLRFQNHCIFKAPHLLSVWF